MFGIEALDVVIGMIFIYLLFSLFVTIVNEGINSFLQIRAKELRFVITKMLGKSVTKLYEDKRLSSLSTRSPFLISPFYGAHKRVLPSEIPTKLFIDIILKEIKKLLNEAGLKTSNLNELINAFNENVLDQIEQNFTLKDSVLDSKIIQEMLLESNSYIELKDKIDDWYEDEMLALSDWYKRKLRYVLLGLGFLTAFIFNVDSISIFKTLVNDPSARALVVEQAQTYVDNHQLNEGFIVPVTLTDSTKSIRIDTLKGGFALRKFLDNEFENRLKNSLPGTYPNEIDSTTYVDSLSKKIQADLSNEFPVLVQLDSTYQKLDLLIEEDIKHLSTILGLGWETQKYGSFVEAVLNQTTFFTFVGWLITAIALSMGAPFWYDLLRKVINIKNELKGKQNKPVG